MVTRRKLILSGAGLLAAGLPQTMLAADDPAGILTAIYARVAKGKGDSGGTFVVQKAARPKYLSRLARRKLARRVMPSSPGPTTALEDAK